MMHEVLKASDQTSSVSRQSLMNRLAPLAIVALILVETACDGGPPNGDLTVKNNTDRPVMRLADGSLDEALAEAGYVQLNAVIEPGESAETTLLRTYDPEARWCMVAIDYWVIASNTDDVTDFQRPIDPATVTVQEHLVDRCWDGPNDKYSIE